MANFKNHIFFNIVLFIPISYVINNYYIKSYNTLNIIVNTILLFSISIMFSLWPDIDTKSIGQKIFYIFFFITDIMLISTGKINESAYLGLLVMLPIITNHRGFFHSLFAVFFFPMIFLIAPAIYYNSFTFSKIKIGFPYYLAGVIGYLSHYILDGLLWKKIKRVFL